MRYRKPKISDLEKAIDLSINPAGMRFEDYREAMMLTPWLEENGRKVKHSRPEGDALWKEGFNYRVWEQDNWWAKHPSEYGTWKNILEAGRSYLVGSDVPMVEFIKRHSSSLNGWQRLAWLWCTANPEKQLDLLATKGGSWSLPATGFAALHYVIRRRGEYVEIGLPDHDAGGEKHWVSLTGKTKVLINVD